MAREEEGTVHRSLTWKIRRRLPPLVAACIAALVFAPQAAAHAELEETRPSNDAVVEESPDQVLLRFSEAVESALGSVRVFDGNGEQVDSGQILRPRASEVAVAIGDQLPNGTYTVTWRVISADSDPIRGAFVFHVGAPGPQPSGIAAEVLEGTPAVVSVFYTGGRFFDFALLLLCAGGVAALVVALVSAEAALRRRLYGLVAVLAAALAIVATLGLVFQGAAAGGFGLAEAFRWDVVSSVLETRFGKASLVRIILALSLVGIALALRRSSGRVERIGLVGAGLIAVGMLATPSASGHASVSGPLGLASDFAHIAAAAMWTGGLAFVVIALLLAGKDCWPLATRCVPRFSLLAMGSVGVLIVAGVVNGYLQVRTWRALWETTYGLLLLGKVGLLLPLLALGAYNNRYAVPRLKADIASRGEQRRFLQAAGAELAIMVAVVAVTSVLVNAPPAKTQIEMHGAAEMEVQLGDIPASLSVEPGTTGANAIHLMIHAEHSAEALEEVTISATLASRGIGPLQFSAKPAGELGWVVSGAQLTIAGDWQLRIEARRGEFEVLTQTVSVSIREE
jgi:copper transport protein